jgi:hypothetical protein
MIEESGRRAERCPPSVASTHAVEQSLAQRIGNNAPRSSALTAAYNIPRRIISWQMIRCVSPVHRSSIQIARPSRGRRRVRVVGLLDPEPGGIASSIIQSFHVDVQNRRMLLPYWRRTECSGRNCASRLASMSGESCLRFCDDPFIAGRRRTGDERSVRPCRYLLLEQELRRLLRRRARTPLLALDALVAAFGCLPIADHRASQVCPSS